MYESSRAGQPFQKSETVNKSKVFQALSLPSLSNINARSVYNKLDELHTFINEEEIDVIFLSETWERESLNLETFIELGSHKVYSSPYQRKGKGGRTAIIANNVKYDTENITNTIIQVPWGVEAT